MLNFVIEVFHWIECNISALEIYPVLIGDSKRLNTHSLVTTNSQRASVSNWNQVLIFSKQIQILSKQIHWLDEACLFHGCGRFYKHFFQQSFLRIAEHHKYWLQSVSWGSWQSMVLISHRLYPFQPHPSQLALNLPVASLKVFHFHQIFLQAHEL